MNKNILKILIGLMFIITGIIAYMDQLEYLIELTFVSNTLGGIILIIDGILSRVKNKKLPSILYLVNCVAILLVFIVCMVSLTGVFKFNFQGAFFFMHVSNPIIFLICYLVFVNEREKKFKYVLLSPILVIIYFLFDYFLGYFRGNFVYGFVEASKLGIFNALIVGLVMYVMSLSIGLAVFYLNKIVNKNRRN